MNFEIYNLELLDILKMVKGFVTKSIYRPILTTVHITAKEESDVVTFFATNSAIGGEWAVGTTVTESGECSIVITDYMLALLKSYKNPVKVTFATCTDGSVEIHIGKNALIFEQEKGTYPKIDNVFDIDPIEVKPIVDISSLLTTLKSMYNAGIRRVELSIQKSDNITVHPPKMMFVDYDEIKRGKVRAIMTTVRKWR